MAKALMGSFATPRTIELLDEVRSLRARVADLERALAEAAAAAEGETIVTLEDEPAREAVTA